MSLQNMREPGPVSAVQSGGTIAATTRTVNQGAQIRVNELSFLLGDGREPLHLAEFQCPESARSLSSAFVSCPVAISYKTAPNENKPVRASSSFARAFSGEMYAMVPKVLPGQGFNSSVAGPLQCVLEATSQGHRIALKSIVYVWKAVCNNQLSGLGHTTCDDRPGA